MEITPQDLPEENFWRLTNESECHRGLQYRTGLNVDPIPFNPTGNCQEGGMYFFGESQLPDFYSFISDARYMRRVTFPPDSRIYQEEGKYKTNKFILGERTEFFLPPGLCLAACTKNGYALQFVKEQTPDIGLAACIQN